LYVDTTAADVEDILSDWHTNASSFTGSKLWC